MTGPTIEDRFTPETTNEVLLLNRIRELKRTLWERGADPYRLSLGEVTVQSPAPPVLRLATLVEVEEDRAGGYYIRGSTHPKSGADGLGFAYYVSPDFHHNITKFQLARFLDDSHQRVIKSMAEVLGKADARNAA